jgi:hypothetical protein
MLSSLVRASATIWGVLTRTTFPDPGGNWPGGMGPDQPPQACIDIISLIGQAGLGSPFGSDHACAEFVNWRPPTIPPSTMPAVHVAIASKDIRGEGGDWTAICAPVVIVTGLVPFQQGLVARNCLWWIGTPGPPPVFNGGQQQLADVQLAVHVDGTAAYVSQPMLVEGPNPNRWFEATIEGVASGKVQVKPVGLP